ncbi:MAG: hypothetical protein F6K42_35695, partial [Leptolyngbya sp. SIO1D8]|nr:hypothetical protein [Leptolyngbya sp. SIO1D8]
MEDGRLMAMLSLHQRFIRIKDIVTMAQANSSPQPGNTPASNSPAFLSVLSFDGQDDCIDFGVQPHFKVQKHLTLELWAWIESQR